MSESVLQLDPTKVQSDDNIRFSLKPEKIESLKQSILDEGRILEPVAVEAVTGSKNGVTHRLLYGFYRHEALTQLNKEGAGLTLPAILISREDALARLKTQVAENLSREELSPMDKAIAMDRMMKEGMSRGDVRRLFSVTGGRKGNTLTPMSNALLNIHLRFLELPKSFQERIHDGRLGVAAAYELGRVSPDKRQAVLDRAEEERLKTVAAEEKEEERYLALESKLVEKEKERDETSKARDEAKQAVIDAEAILRARQTEEKEAQSTPWPDDEAQKKVVQEKITGAANNVKAAAKLVKDAKNKYAKLLGKSKTAAETATELAKKLEDARKLAKKKPVKPSAVSPKEIKKAAAAEGETTGQVALSLADIKEAVQYAAKQTDYPKVAAIFKHVAACFAGGPTAKEMVFDIAVRVTGEAKLPPTTPAKK